MTIRADRLALRVASALLLHEGELALTDIRSLPFYESPEDPEGVIEAIIRNYDVEVYTKRIASTPVPEWEKVIRLRQ